MYVPNRWWHAVINLEESIGLPCVQASVFFCAFSRMRSLSESSDIGFHCAERRHQEADAAKWQEDPAQPFWFRINKLNKQKRKKDAADVLAEAAAYFSDPEADLNNYAIFRIQLNVEWGRIMQVVMKAGKCGGAIS